MKKHALCAAFLAACAYSPAYSQVIGSDGNDSPAVDSRLLSMSMKDLMDMEVVTVSKKEERAFDVPAAIYVLTGEDFKRSGATNIMDALRVVPGLNVAKDDSSTWSVSSRGFNDQFANKLLVLVDGRSIYNPHFSGVFWGTVNVPLEDIERVEVIRGPGASIWGANAVNGVINIITKDSAKTQGGYVSTLAGNYNKPSGEARYGGKIGGNTTYRVYGKYDKRANSRTLAGADAQDDWWVGNAGFRSDYEANETDTLTLQGDIYNETLDSSFNKFLTPRTDDIEVDGGSAIVKWHRQLEDGGDIDLQFYADHDFRQTRLVSARADNYNFSLDHNFNTSDRNNVTWGIGYRLTYDDYERSGVFYVDPESRYNQLYNAFVQDQYYLIPEKLAVVAGTKLEHNSYTGFEIQPTVKLVATPDENNTVWLSVARAVRTPSRVEDSLRLLTQTLPAGYLYPGSPKADLLAFGNPSLKAEDLIAYELGYRTKTNENLHLDFALYYNDYGNLVSTGYGSPMVNRYGTGSPLAVPVMYYNEGEGSVYGFESSATWQATDSWRLMGSYTLAFSDIGAKLGQGFSRDPDTVMPKHVASLRSYLDVTDDLEFNAALYYVDDLKGAGVDGCLKADAQITWFPLESLELSLAGQNLFDAWHQEFPDSLTNSAREVGRSFYGKVTVRF